MSAYYCPSNPVLGHTRSHVFCRWVIDREPSKWYVMGIDSHTTSGFAVIDDYGDLIEVPV
jgi:hypothetical protein